MIILSKMNKENRIGYIRKAMNLLKLKRTLMAACMLLSLGFGMSSCTLETSDNGYFDGVIRGCSKTNGRYWEDGAWLGENIIQAFTALHEQGFAASVEVWDNETDELVGGLYGVTIGKVFIGESMFSRVPSASKIALIFLARYLQEHGGKMIDCQLETPHLKSMGGRYISYEEYMKIMNEE